MAKVAPVHSQQPWPRHVTLAANLNNCPVSIDVSPFLSNKYLRNWVNFNLLERWFALIDSQAVRRGVFDSVARLQRAGTCRLAHWNRHVRSFCWTVRSPIHDAQSQALLLFTRRDEGMTSRSCSLAKAARPGGNDFRKVLAAQEKKSLDKNGRSYSDSDKRSRLRFEMN